MSFWSFDGIAANCSCIAFEESTTNILIGFRDGQIASVSTATGQILKKIQAFTHRIRAIVQAPQRPDVILCHTKAEILLYARVEGTLCSQPLFNVASVKSNVANLCIKQVLWTRSSPATLAVLCLLSDDSIFVWENERATGDSAPDKLIKTFELRKHIHPMEGRNGRTQKTRESTPDDENNNNLCATVGHSGGGGGEIWALSSLTTEASQVAVCGADQTSIILDAKQWNFVEVIRLPKCMKKPLVTVERSFAESTLDRTVETVWAAINECGQLFFFEKSENVIPPIASMAVAQVTKIRISNDGKLMATVQNDGRILLLDTEFFLRHSLAHPSISDSATLLCANYNQQMRETNRKVRPACVLAQKTISIRFPNCSCDRCFRNNDCEPFCKNSANIQPNIVQSSGDRC